MKQAQLLRLSKLVADQAAAIFPVEGYSKETRTRAAKVLTNKSPAESLAENTKKLDEYFSIKLSQQQANPSQNVGAVPPSPLRRDKKPLRIGINSKALSWEDIHSMPSDQLDARDIAALEEYDLLDFGELQEKYTTLALNEEDQALIASLSKKPKIEENNTQTQASSLFDSPPAITGEMGGFEDHFENFADQSFEMARRFEPGQDGEAFTLGDVTRFTPVKIPTGQKVIEEDQEESMLLPDISLTHAPEVGLVSTASRELLETTQHKTMLFSPTRSSLGASEMGVDPIGEMTHAIMDMTMLSPAKTKRKRIGNNTALPDLSRRLVLDNITEIPSEEMQRRLKETTDILRPLKAIQSEVPQPLEVHEWLNELDNMIGLDENGDSLVVSQGSNTMIIQQDHPWHDEVEINLPHETFLSRQDIRFQDDPIPQANPIQAIENSPKAFITLSSDISTPTLYPFESLSAPVSFKQEIITAVFRNLGILRQSKRNLAAKTFLQMLTHISSDRKFKVLQAEPYADIIVQSL